jgi:hypothetical protein
VKLDANLSSGNGSGDMALLVPQSAFAGASPGTFVYLYSLFGAQPGEGANGGFEQWWVPNVLPTPAVQSLSGSVVLSSTNAGISGVTIVLNGTDTQGNAITATTTTDVNGNFSFMNIPAGNYFITQMPPPPLVLVGESLGNVNGNLSGTMDLLNDSFDNVMVGSGQNGINYVFIDSSGIVG